jgi:hypothetical protein
MRDKAFNKGDRPGAEVGQSGLRQRNDRSHGIQPGHPAFLPDAENGVTTIK